MSTPDETSQPHLISEAEKAELRRVIARWVNKAWRASGKSKEEIAQEMGKSPSWVSNRTTAAGHVTPSMEELLEVARVADYLLTDQVRKAREMLSGMAHTRRRDVANHLPEPPPEGTAEVEMAALIDLAQRLQRTKVGARNAEILRMRFGVGHPEPVRGDMLAKLYGVTRQRVSLLELAAIKALASVATHVATPQLDAVLEQTRQRIGMPEATVEAELRPLLGSVGLKEALRFRQAIRVQPGRLRTDIAGVTAGVRTRGSVKIIASGAEPATKLVQQVSTVARKIYTYAGAASVPDVRAFVEATVKRDIPSRKIVGLIDGLPHVRWLAGGQRWFTFNDAHLTPVLERAAAIITVARQPVDFETIYAGLAREGRADRPGTTGNFAEPLPPPPIVQELLDIHPAFVRRRATSFDLAITQDLWPTRDSYEGAIIAEMDARGGVMAKADMVNVRRVDGAYLQKKRRRGRSCCSDQPTLSAAVLASTASAVGPLQ